MPALATDIKKLLTKTSLVVFPEDYIAVYLPTGIKAIPGEWFRPVTTRFAVVIQEPELITMIVPLRKWLRMKNMFEKYDVSGPLKAITFDVKLSLVAGGSVSQSHPPWLRPISTQSRSLLLSATTWSCRRRICRARLRF